MVLALAGCASGVEGALSEPDFTPEQSEASDEGETEGESSASEPEAQNADSPRAFVFESGKLEFGDFDPYTIGNELFSPCTEITDAEFAKAGFHGKGKLMTHRAGDITGCAFDERDGHWYFGSSFSSSNLNYQLHLEADLVLHQYGSDIVPEIYVVKGTWSGGCYAQIDTVRGGVGANVGGSEKKTTMDERCQRAIAMLEDLYLTHHLPAS